MQLHLVERAQQGDHEAFASLASANVDRCYAIARRILRDPDRAEDGVQHAPLGAWRDLPTLREPERFEAWLHRLVINACYTEARGQRRWTAHIRVLPRETPIDPDSGLGVLRGWAGPELLPDGSRILYQDDLLYSMRPDGTDAHRVTPMDMTTDVSGYVYIVHWIPGS